MRSIIFQKYTNNQEMHFNIIFYSQYSQHHVSAGILAIFRVRFLLQKYKSDVHVTVHRDKFL